MPKFNNEIGSFRQTSLHRPSYVAKDTNRNIVGVLTLYSLLAIYRLILGVS